MLIKNPDHRKNPWVNGIPGGRATYIPSALLLLMAIDNGWEVVKVQPVARWENYGKVYLLTVRCDSGEEQTLIIPQNALIDKILEEHGPARIPVC